MTQRTLNQNSAFWLYCDLLAVQLNEAGWDLTTAIIEEKLRFPVGWTEQNIANIIARPIMKALWPEGPPDDNGNIKPWKNPDRPSTTELSTVQISQVYETMNQASAIKFGVSLPFPSEEELFQRSQGRK